MLLNKIFFFKHRIVKKVRRIAFLASFLIVLPSVIFAPNKLLAAEEDALSLKQNLKNVPIRELVEAIAKITKKNFILDPRISGNASMIGIGGMPPEELYSTFLAILAVHNYIAVDQGDNVLILPANEAVKSLEISSGGDTRDLNAWTTEIIDVNSVQAADTVNILKPLISKNANLVALRDSNKLIVTDSLRNIKRIRQILRSIDTNISGNFLVVKVKYLVASDLLKQLNRIKNSSKNLKIIADDRTNRLIIDGSKSDKKTLFKLIKTLDVESESGSNGGGVKVIFLKYAVAIDIVPILQKLLDNSASINALQSAAKEETPAGATNKKPAPQVNISKSQLKESVNIQADNSLNAIILVAPPAIVKAVESIIKTLDVRRAQVLIEGIIVELGDGDRFKFGIDWGVLSNGGALVTGLEGRLSSLASGFNTEASQRANAVAGIAGISDSESSISYVAGQETSPDQGWIALVRALSTSSNSNVLSTPSILTLDNKEALVKVGREISVATGNYNSSSSTAGSVNPFTTFERKDVGLTLKVKPQISKDGEILLDIDQEISNVVPNSTGSQPTTAKKQIKTSVQVSDGRIVVLGGLISEQETVTQRKIPVLGDLPLIGGLFRYRETLRDRQNLIIFLRPIVLKTKEDEDQVFNAKYKEAYKMQQDILSRDNNWFMKDIRPNMKKLEDFLRTPSFLKKVSEKD